MWRDYFEVDGKRYYTGTVFLTKYIGRQVEASFIGYDLKLSKYVYKVGAITVSAYDEWFWDTFIGVTGKINPNANIPVIKRKKELSINGMLTGWTWYIVLMLMSVIFKDAIGLWVFISIVFFSWRNEKINKEGYYVER